MLAAQAEADNPLPSKTSQRAEVLPLWRSPFGAQTYMMPVVVLLGAMGTLVLIIVCANVANLVLVRGVGRRGELAVRVALGAGRGRILRLLFVENLVLALPGAILGVILSAIAMPLMWGGDVGRGAHAGPSRYLRGLDGADVRGRPVVLERAGLRLRSGAADLARGRGGAP